MTGEDRGGCTGVCCAAFRIGYTVTEMRRNRNPANGKRIEDAEQIADMVVRLTPKEARERNLRFGGNGMHFRWDDRGHHFTCRHWDEGTRLCTVYKDRPAMCSGFPYGREGGCPFGCSVRGEAHPEKGRRA